jgi:hypothetical protein
MMVNEWWIWKDVEGKGCCLIQATIPPYSSKNWAKSRKSSVRRVGVLTEIPNGYPPKIRQ